MKSSCILKAVLILLGLGCTCSVYAQSNNVQGAYTNIDNNGWVTNLALCPKDKAILDGSVTRQYEVILKDDHTYIKIRSNGLFLLEVADHGDLLIPKNKFTKQRMTAKAMKRNSTSIRHCAVESGFY